MSHLTVNAKATTPAVSGAEALDPVNFSVHCSLVNVVGCYKRIIDKLK